MAISRTTVKLHLCAAVSRGTREQLSVRIVIQNAGGLVDGAATEEEDQQAECGVAGPVSILPPPTTLTYNMINCFLTWRRS